MLIRILNTSVCGRMG